MISLKKLSVLNINRGRPGVMSARFLVMFMTIALKRWLNPPIVTSFNIVAHTVEKCNDGFQTVGKKKKRKGKSKSTNGDTSPKNDNFTTSNSFSALNDEEEYDEEFENVYDESANLVPNTNTSGSSYFTTAAG
ncbi:hypothetical protein Tco_1246174 [Tanacetum coccineum]